MKTPTKNRTRKVSQAPARAPGKTHTRTRASAKVKREIERELPRGFEDWAPLSDLGRREFFRLVGSGLVIVFAVDPLLALQEPTRLPRGRQGYPSDFNAYLRVGEDGRVTCFVGKVELGQGNKTSLAQLLAEELEVSLETVDMVMGDTDRCPWDMGTFGSLSIRMFGPVLRAAAAEAREVLLGMAAERLKVPVARLAAKDGAIADKSDPKKRVTYAQLTEGKRILRHLEKKPELRAGPRYDVIGLSAPRRDGLEKVTGRAKYAGDVTFPGMLHGRVLCSPRHGAKLKSLDTSRAEKLPGARVVREDDLVAVLHAEPDQAAKGVELIRAEYDLPAAIVDDQTIFAHLVQAAPKGELVDESGSLAEGEKLSKERFDETYFNGYVAHAPMETHTAVAKMEDDRMTVWASTQAPFIVKRQVSEALGLPEGKVRVITPYVGAGFGGKTSGPQAVQAARLAKMTGRPVQVVWERPDEFFHDTFRPAAVVKIRSGVGADGKMTFWDFDVYCAGDREAKQFYDIPHQRTVSHGGWHGDQPGLHPFAVGPWRAPSVNTNTFARESQIDLMASKTGVDPVEFRMRHLSDPRLRRVLQAAADKFGWKAKPAPSGRGVGAACALYLGTYVATMAEVAVDAGSGHVQTKRLVCAQDMGVAVNPEGARQQMEGSLTMGLGYALTEEVHFKGGEILEKNFGTYEIPRFTWLPKIDTVLIDTPGVPFSGGGEPPIVCMGAVIANAIHDAVGVRMLQLPMTPGRIKAALARKATAAKAATAVTAGAAV